MLRSSDICPPPSLPSWLVDHWQRNVCQQSSPRSPKAGPLHLLKTLRALRSISSPVSNFGNLWIDGRSHEKSGKRSFQTEEPEAFKAVAWFPRDVPRLQIHTISLFPVLEPKRIQIASAKSWHWIDLAFRCERRLQTCTYFSFFCSSLRWV